MADNSQMTIGAKIMLGFTILCFAFAISKCVRSVSGSSDESNKTDDINLDNIEQVQQAIQGKWSESLPSSVASESMYFRLLIEGNKVTIWTKMGFDKWNMNTPEETHTIEIGEKTHQVDGIPCRYLYWDEETLLTRSIGTLHVTDCCILFSGSVRPLTSGWE